MPPPSFLTVLRRLLTTAAEGSRHARAALWISVFTIVFLLVGSWVIVPIEESAPHATITTFPRAVWWSIETATTVGYGDFFPVTAWGRVIASLIMFVGISAYSVITAAVATWFVSSAATRMRQLAGDARRIEERGRTQAADDLHALHERFDRVEALLRDPGPPGTPDDISGR